jgi:hypothetical protein
MGAGWRVVQQVVTACDLDSDTGLDLQLAATDDRLRSTDHMVRM